MSVYLDTSILIALVAAEPSAPTVRAWWRRQGETSMALSDWTLAEVASALAIKRRQGRYPRDDQYETAYGFIDALVDPLPRLSVADRHLQEAARLVRRSESGLRAADALHLAIAADHDLTLVTLDKGQALGARAWGLSADLLASASAD